MIKLKTLLYEVSDVKDYPQDVQDKYNKYLQTWGRDFADAYLEREPDPNDSIDNLKKEIYKRLKSAKQKTADEINNKKLGSDKYVPLLTKNYKNELNKIGKITDIQINKLFDDKFKTVWDEADYLLKIFKKQKM